MSQRHLADSTIPGALYHQQFAPWKYWSLLPIRHYQPILKSQMIIPSRQTFFLSEEQLIHSNKSKILPYRKLHHRTTVVSINPEQVNTLEVSRGKERIPTGLDLETKSVKAGVLLRVYFIHFYFWVRSRVYVPNLVDRRYSLIASAPIFPFMVSMAAHPEQQYSDQTPTD